MLICVFHRLFVKFVAAYCIVIVNFTIDRNPKIDYVQSKLIDLHHIFFYNV